MTIFLPFQFCIFSHSDIFHCFGQAQFFKKSLKIKENAAKLQNFSTTLYSRFYPEIFFQSMKNVSPPAFYRACTKVWPVY